jgi:hypothetical protein
VIIVVLEFVSGDRGWALGSGFVAILVRFFFFFFTRLLVSSSCLPTSEWPRGGAVASIFGRHLDDAMDHVKAMLLE